MRRLGLTCRAMDLRGRIFYYNEKRGGWQVRRIRKANAAIRQTEGILVAGSAFKHKRRKNYIKKQPCAEARLNLGTAAVFLWLFRQMEKRWENLPATQTGTRTHSAFSRERQNTVWHFRN